MVDVLLHFQNMPNLKKFGFLGFHRLNGYESSKNVYKRTHCYSTLILDLYKLKEVDFDERAFVFEDILFNRDVSEKKIVICKCYRFAFSSPQLKEGGCSSMIAPGGQVSPLPQTQQPLQPLQPPQPPQMDELATMIRFTETTNRKRE